MEKTEGRFSDKISESRRQAVPSALSYAKVASCRLLIQTTKSFEMDITATDKTPQSLNEEGYVSSEDEDFNPNADAMDVDGESTDSEADELQAQNPIKKKVLKSKNDEAEDIGFENSGDEAIMKKGQKRKRKNKVDEDSGGEGGFVKTRSMKAVE